MIKINPEYFDDYIGGGGYLFTGICLKVIDINERVFYIRVFYRDINNNKNIIDKLKFFDIGKKLIQKEVNRIEKMDKIKFYSVFIDGHNRDYLATIKKIEIVHDSEINVMFTKIINVYETYNGKNLNG
jgi:hypothetical protein